MGGIYITLVGMLNARKAKAKAKAKAKPKTDVEIRQNEEDERSRRAIAESHAYMRNFHKSRGYL